MPIYGCIADDFTGATDIAGILVNGGLRVVVVLNIEAAVDVSSYDAVVVALKSRTVAPEVAVHDSLQALEWLRRQGCARFHFKYCSTFDSRPTGNIGPVIDALMIELGTDFTIVCPAFPANGRTVYQGHLFVWQTLLSESSMRNHPLTPMLDSNLIRLLTPQTEQSIALVPHQTVAAGVQALRIAFDKMRVEGTAVAVVDAIDDGNLEDIAIASDRLVLTTGASGLAVGIPAALELAGLLRPSVDTWRVPKQGGPEIILSGSCSAATLQQVAHAETRMPIFRLEALKLAEDPLSQVSEALQWVADRSDQSRLLISASTSGTELRIAQEGLGADVAGEIVERAISDIAVALARHGVSKFIVAGGETSGAVVKALEIASLQVGQQIDPGVHWALGQSATPIALALKSGNFGSADFFSKAWNLL